MNNIQEVKSAREIDPWELVDMDRRVQARLYWVLGTRTLIEVKPEDWSIGKFSMYMRGEARSAAGQQAIWQKCIEHPKFEKIRSRWPNIAARLNVQWLFGRYCHPDLKIWRNSHAA